MGSEPRIPMAGDGHGGTNTALYAQRQRTLSCSADPQVGKGREQTAMLTTGEQQELRQIEDALREQDRGFGRRLAVLQGVLRWAAPGRRDYLLAVAAVAAALLRVVTAAGRLLIAAGYCWSALVLDSSALMAPGDAGCPGRESGPGPGNGPGPA